MYGKFRNWIGRITHNAALDFVKSHKRHNVKIDHFKDHGLHKISENQLDEIAEKEWQNYLTSMAWKNLEGKCSDKSRQIFEKIMEGCKAETIASDYDVSVNTVYVYKKRVQDQLITEINLLKDLLE